MQRKTKTPAKKIIKLNPEDLKLQNFPDEMLLNICDYLTNSEKIVLSSTAKQFRILLGDNITNPKITFETWKFKKEEEKRERILKEHQKKVAEIQQSIKEEKKKAREAEALQRSCTPLNSAKIGAAAGGIISGVTSAPLASSCCMWGVGFGTGVTAGIILANVVSFFARKIAGHCVGSADEKEAELTEKLKSMPTPLVMTKPPYLG